jgi:hypothetical protein
MFDTTSEAEIIEFPLTRTVFLIVEACPSYMEPVTDETGRIVHFNDPLDADAYMRWYWAQQVEKKAATSM